MLNRRLPAAAALAVTLLGLAGCRTSPDVAAYVGDERVTVDRLQDAVDARLADPAVAAAAEAQPDEFTRSVLTRLVQDELYQVAAARSGVQVTDRDVRERLEAIIGDEDPEALYAQLAQQGLGRDDVFLVVRQQLLLRGIAEAGGLAPGLEESALRARYEEVRGQFAEVELGFVTVPDQATADSVLAALTADPEGYPAVAARYAGPNTLPETQSQPLSEVPAPLQQQATAAAPGTGFTAALPQAGGVVVGFVVDRTEPTFDALRPRLEQEALTAADDRLQALLDGVREDLDVALNPRYGQLEDGVVAPLRGGPVEILGAGV